MKRERGEEILSAGIGAARERFDQYPMRPDYLHDYGCLYGWLEDKLFNLYGAVCRKDYRHIRQMAGEIIITASEVAEYTNMRLESPKEAGR